MNHRVTTHGLPLIGFASAGVLAGHWLGYVLAMPDAHLRQEMLAASGHAYWLLAVKVGVCAGAIALASLVLSALGAALRGDRPEDHGPVATLLRLLSLQVIGFTAMEITERVAAGAPLAGLLQHHVFLLGLAAQVLVAGVLACVLFALGRTVALVFEALSSPPEFRRADRVFSSLPFAAPPLRVLPLGGAGLRAPPAR